MIHSPSSFPVSQEYSEKDVLPKDALHKGVHTLFEEQARQRPTQIAILHGERQITYADLNRRANQLAGSLRSLSLEEGRIVAVCLDRSIECVVAFLAIAKAGCAYLPIDPTWPTAAQDFQLEDARVTCILTLRRFAATVPVGNRTLLFLDDLWAHQPLLQEEEEPDSGPFDPNRLLYVMYTSGSTGVPKGVCIPHRGVIRLVCHTNYMQVREDDRMAHLSHLSFDASTFEIWTPLLNGACLVIFSQDEVLTPDRFREALETSGITKLFLTTRLFHLYARLAPETFGTLEDVFVGGEQVNPAAIRSVLATGKRPGRLINVYGPTEATTYATWYAVPPVLDEQEHSIPLGHPISGTSLSLLDQHMQPVAQGEAGEICLGGPGLALGYLHRPDLTAERFIEHDTFGRLYRTGDLGRMRADGNLEFLGRLDQQVKINGIRIEPAEVEALLLQYPGVREVAVVARPDQTQNLFLTAYVAAEERLTVQILTDFLSQRVRDRNLIPSLFVHVPALPQTANEGKVDRRALRQHDPASFGEILQRSATSSRLETLEQQVQEAYAHIKGPTALAQEQALDSLATAEFASHLASALHLDARLILKLVLAYPNLRDLAIALQTAQTLNGPGSNHEMEPIGESERQPEQEELPSFVRVEPHPLLRLILSGHLRRIDAAALAYLPPEPHLAQYRAQLEHWYHGGPLMTHLVETAQGRIGLFSLPIEADALYVRHNDLLALALEALGQAQQAGARVAALTGLLPSALAYGRVLSAALSGREDLPRITTGHATTTAAVVMTIEALVHHVAGRDLASEDLAFLGLGSIGPTTLRLLLSVLPHPRRLLLCDLYPNKLAPLTAWIRANGYQGELMVLPSTGEVPEEIYSATCIVGATNVADVLDVWRLRPGTLIIDDSGPHCFATKEALARMQTQGDILAIEGGEFRLPTAAREVRHLPATPTGMDVLLRQEEMLALRQDPYEIMGCLNAGLLSVAWGLPTTLGPVPLETSLLHYQALQAHGFQAARPHLEQTVLPAELLSQFRARFGTSTSAESEQCHR